MSITEGGKEYCDILKKYLKSKYDSSDDIEKRIYIKHMKV